MKTILAALIMLSFSLPALASPKSCNELKTEIERKLDVAAVPNYSVEIVPAEHKVERGLVVGACGNGTKKIVYLKHDR